MALVADDIILRPLAEGDEAELRRIHEIPEVARWWDLPADNFPWDEPEATRQTIEVDGRVAGLIQFGEELEPKYRHAWIDLFVDPAVHGRGVGTEAVRRVVSHLIDDRGHHRITIDPAIENVAAARAYEKVGFRRVGVMRRAERDADGAGWHDSLLMELLAGEKIQRPAAVEFLPPCGNFSPSTEERRPTLVPSTERRAVTTPYTHKKLADVEDSAPRFGFGEIQEARFAGAELEAERTGFSHHRIKPDRRQGFAHRHERAEEVYVVLSGSGSVKLDDDILELDALDALRVAPGVTRQFEAGPGGLELLAFGARHDGDGEVIPGWWSD